MACSWWRAFLVQNSTSSLTLLHLYTASHWFKSTSRHHAIFAIMRSDLFSWKFGRWSALSGIAPFSQVSIKHRATEFEKSLFNRESRMSSSILLCRERRFAKWMLGNGVLNPRWRSFMSAPVLCRILHPCQIMQCKCPAKHQNRRNPVKYRVVCTSECPAIRLWWNWLQGYD